MSHETENTRAGVKPAIICYVTDRRSLAGSDLIAALLSSIRSATAAGVDWVQIREKDLTARELLALTNAATRAACESQGAGRPSARVIVNDRLDVALAARAGGVHLGRESVAVGDVVRWCRSGNAPPEFLIGVSCHSVEEVQAAAAAGASYAIFGPVFDTPSKRPFGSPQGISKLVEACKTVRIPVIAIGGVDQEKAAECLRAGAAGVAAIRLFQNTAIEPLADLVSKLHELRVHA